MARSGKLRPALDRQTQRDFKLEKQRKLEKTAEKRRKAKAPAQLEDEEEDDDVVGLPRATGEGEESLGEGVGWETEDDDDEDEVANGFDASRLEDSDSDDSGDEVQMEQPIRRSNLKKGAPAVQPVIADPELPDEVEDEEDIPLSDLDSIASEDKGDIIPHQRLSINNTAALLAAVKRIALPTSSLPFSEHQSITTDDPVSIADIDDDLNRELAFYKQSLTAAQMARTLLKKEGTLFSRPADYFAEMVKSDEHMGKVKQKLVDQAASKKASHEARKLRDAKKFGKAVQVEKQRERDRLKRETLEKINSLKRKRSGADLTSTNEDDIFDVALEDAAVTEKKDKEARRQARGKNGKPGMKRQKRDEKFGFGGKKRHSKSNDAMSTSDMKGFSTKGMKANSFGGGGGGGGKKGFAAKRPGKSRRAKAR